MQQIFGYCPNPRDLQRSASLPVTAFGSRGTAKDVLDDQSIRSGAFSTRSSENSRLPGSLRSPCRSPRSPHSQRLWAHPESEFSEVSEVSTRSSCTLSIARTSGLAHRATKLRGSGVLFGQRGSSSAGIPWRQLPIYSQKGAMQVTGDVVSGTPEAKRREIAMTHRGRSQFSQELGSGQGLREVLETVEENSGKLCQHASPAAGQSPQAVGGSSPVSFAAGLATPRQAWLELVKRRTVVKCELDRGSGELASSAPEPDLPQDTPRLHWSYRQQKAGMLSDFNTKDSCPFAREDSNSESRSMAAATPNKCRVRSPRTSLQGSAARPNGNFGPGVGDILLVADKLPTARRDFPLIQELVGLEEARVSGIFFPYNLSLDSWSPPSRKSGLAACSPHASGTERARWRK